MRKKQGMTGWYDPVQLIKTGIRVAISTVFGQFADKREALAAANRISDEKLDSSFDYSGEGTNGAFWFDYVADTGDGWKPTFAVAQSLAEDHLHPPGAEEPLDRGRILIMGGDQVYPTASPEEYENRLVYPFDEAYHPEGGTPRWPKEASPDLYAVPGNHDWYDGLKSFFHLFCRRTIKADEAAGVDREGKTIGGRRTWQTRSYFALKLPGDWWLWGVDGQLEGYIDQPQIDYFQFVADKWMQDGSKLILCVAAPDWEYVTRTNAEAKFSTFSYLERLAGAVEGKTIKLRLVVSGDSHHYARYQEVSTERKGEEGQESRLDYITSGGGGAFLHPTHHLETEKVFDFKYPPPGVRYDRSTRKPYERRFELARQSAGGEYALYPSRSRSRWLTLLNILFPVWNWKFPLMVLLPAYLTFTWLLDFNSRVSGRGTLAESLARGGLWDSMREYWELVVVSPWAVILVLAALGGYRYFADVKNSAGRLAVGAIHAGLHATAVTAVTCFVIRWTATWWDGFFGIAGSLVAASAASALASGFVFGFYLGFVLLVSGRHWNEGYSSLGLTGYKGFLRMKIDGNGRLTVFPIGLRRPSSPPELIEPPIVIS